MLDRRGDRGGAAVHRQLADPLRPAGSAGVRRLDEDRRERRRVEARRDDVVRHPRVQDLPVPRHELLRQRPADRLERSALDLPGAEDRVHHAADVDRGPEAGHLRLERVEVDLHLRDVAGPAVRRVGVARVGRVVPDDARRRLVLHEGRRAPGVGGEAIPGDGSRKRPRPSPPRRPGPAARVAACSAIDPTTMTVREATVGPESGTCFVDGTAKSTASICDAEGVGRDLPEDGLGPLADLGRGGPHAGAPAGEEVDGDLSLQVLLPRAGEAGAVEEDGGADAAGDAPGHDRPAGALLGESARRHRLLDALLDADRLLQRLPRRRRVAEAEEVLPPQLHRVDAERPRDAIHVPLDRPDGLRRAEAAEGAVRRRVRRDGERLDGHVLPAVGAAGVERAAREDDRRERDVRAAVEEDADRDGAQRPVPVAAGGDLDARRVPLRRGLDVLLAAVDELHRAARLLREEEGVEGEERRVLLLAAEAAAGDGLRHVDAVVGEAEDPLDSLLDVERALERALDVRALVVPEGDHPVRLDVDVLLGARFVDAAHDDLAPLDGRRRPAPS